MAATEAPIIAVISVKHTKYELICSVCSLQTYKIIAIILGPSKT